MKLLQIYLSLLSFLICQSTSFCQDSLDIKLIEGYWYRIESNDTILEKFEKNNNSIIYPGYCSPGSIGTFTGTLSSSKPLQTRYIPMTNDFYICYFQNDTIVWNTLNHDSVYFERILILNESELTTAFNAHKYYYFRISKFQWSAMFERLYGIKSEKKDSDSINEIDY